MLRNHLINASYYLLVRLFFLPLTVDGGRRCSGPIAWFGPRTEELSGDRWSMEDEVERVAVAWLPLTTGFRVWEGPPIVTVDRTWCLCFRFSSGLTRSVSCSSLWTASGESAPGGCTIDMHTCMTAIPFTIQLLMMTPVKISCILRRDWHYLFMTSNKQLAYYGDWMCLMRRIYSFFVRRRWCLGPTVFSPRNPAEFWRFSFEQLFFHRKWPQSSSVTSLFMMIFCLMVMVEWWKWWLMNE